VKIVEPGFKTWGEFVDVPTSITVRLTKEDSPEKK
jgi:hypothetical protein